MQDGDLSRASLILLAQMHYERARWWQLAAAWAVGRHRIVRHLGRVARISFWGGKPYLLSFRETV
ncbi:hypothetical protein [Pseudogemmobacter sonorensis]|uniref:hypothetical protein n=1 Tax=Pseudogemmobacter sonorensis TaxID=2989681 RepID=UPI00369F4E03